MITWEVFKYDYMRLRNVLIRECDETLNFLDRELQKQTYKLLLEKSSEQRKTRSIEEVGLVDDAVDIACADLSDDSQDNDNNEANGEDDDEDGDEDDSDLDCEDGGVSLLAG